MTQRSHTTQVLQNYFDITDVRTRYNPTALEVQMLNLAGIELEGLGLRANRELNQTLQTVPSAIDNLGVYHSSTVPSSLLTGPDQTTFSSVVGLFGSTPTTLSLYDDTLPIPSRVEVDPRGPVSMPNPLLFTVVGIGDDLTQTYAVQYINPGSFPVPNKLTVWLDQVGGNLLNVILTITGIVAPQPAWVAERVTTTEVLTLTSEGMGLSTNRWASISKIAIRNLPVGVQLRGWSMPFNMPACLDPGRPYSIPDDRDITYSRYWQIDQTNSLLHETYMVGNFTGLEDINTYAISDIMVDVAVEPYTSGMYLASNGRLYYVDRREYQPDLTFTGLTVEPLYGLQVTTDLIKTGSTRYVILSAQPYANFGQIFNYRYTVIMGGSASLMVLYSILPDGSLGPADAGWRQGTPKDVSFALTSPGDYEFRLEMQDINGTTYFDVVPWRNFELSPLKTIDMSSLVDGIQGLAFDSYGQLWVWNGSYAIPLKLHYDGYVFDADTSTIFVTEPFDSLQIT